MNEDGEFVCEEHKPEKKVGQWWTYVYVPEMQCDHCEKQAAYYVLESK